MIPTSIYQELMEENCITFTIKPFSTIEIKV